MVCTEGKTNRECYFFGMGWWGLWDGRKQKEGFAEKYNTYGLHDSIIGGVKMISHLQMVCEIQNLCIIL